MIFIVCPADLVTGGTEALHQLADALNRNNPGRAAMVYRPFNRPHHTPKPFHRYRIQIAEPRSILSGSTIVLPETSADMIDLFPASDIHLWWLSVDNLFSRSGTAADAHMATIASRVSLHLYQSEYARAFLQSTGLGPTAPLADYLADEYRRPAGHPVGPRRDNIVVYNPAKGAHRAELILAALGESVHAVPIADMTRNQIRQLLKHAKVYIDFGEHPGKDRIPREAAALGACVVTNRRGSAANSADVPIPDEYKINDHMPGFEAEAAARIHMIMDDFAAHQPKFEFYRQTISQERSVFLAAAAIYEPAYAHA